MHPIMATFLQFVFQFRNDFQGVGSGFGLIHCCTRIRSCGTNNYYFQVNKITNEMYNLLLRKRHQMELTPRRFRINEPNWEKYRLTRKRKPQTKSYHCFHKIMQKTTQQVCSREEMIMVQFKVFYLELFEFTLPWKKWTYLHVIVKNW